LAEDSQSLLHHESRRLNLSEKFLQRTGTVLGVLPEATTGQLTGLAAEDIFHYVYAVLHSPGYRNRYAEFLKIDFPRLPLTGNLEFFRALTQFGGELVALHLMESPGLAGLITSFSGPKSPVVGRIGWSDDTVWLDAAKTDARQGQRAIKPGTIGFKGVPEEVWDLHIGGYQVCHKWLKDRKGRALSDEDIEHYQKIIVALNETIRIMHEIDEVIDQHGGWAGVFQAGEAEATPAQASPFRPRTVEATPEERYVTCIATGRTNNTTCS
jgi:predicted helicase